MTTARLIQVTRFPVAIPAISSDGRYLAITNAVPASQFIDSALKDKHGLLLVDLQTGSARQLVDDGQSDMFSSTSAIGFSADGSQLLMRSPSMMSISGNVAIYYFLENLATGKFTSLGSGDGTVQIAVNQASFSADGSHIGIVGELLGQDGMFRDRGVYELDARTGAVVPVAVSTETTSGPGAWQTAISADGRYIVYDIGMYKSLADRSPHEDLFVYDTLTKRTEEANVDLNGIVGNGPSFNISLSGNGRYVTFASSSNNLVPDGSGIGGVFVKDLLTGGLRKASSDSYGNTSGTSVATNISHGISDDGRYVLFESTASFGYKELEAGAGGWPLLHLFVKDMVTNAVALVNSTPETINLDTYGATISGDGKSIVFQGRPVVNGQSANSDCYTYVFSLPNFSPVSSNDTLSGTAAADTMAGGLGDDTYIVNNARDLVVEYPNQGRDTVIASVSYTLQANVEVLRLAGDQPINGTGNELDNLIFGNAAANILYGGDGDDVFDGGGGNDRIFGDAGHDTAIFHGKLADFTVTGALAATIRAPDGSVATLTSVEMLVFDDAQVALETDGVAARAYRLYQAAFDRKPDLGGLGYWIAQMEHGMSLETVAAQFVQSNEFKGMFGQSPSSVTLVDLLYQHVLHRPADADGAKFWTGMLDSHKLSAADVLAQFSESPENIAAVIGSIQNGIAYQPYH